MLEHCPAHGMHVSWHWPLAHPAAGRPLKHLTLLLFCLSVALPSYLTCLHGFRLSVSLWCCLNSPAYWRLHCGSLSQLQTGPSSSKQTLQHQKAAWNTGTH